MTVAWEAHPQGECGPPIGQQAVLQLTFCGTTARNPREFWTEAARILAVRAQAPYVRIGYSGPLASGSVEWGTRTEEPVLAVNLRCEQRYFDVAIVGAASSVGEEELEGYLQVAAAIADLIGRRAALENERRRSAFIVELSRWMITTSADPAMLLRHALDSTRHLARAQLAVAAVTSPARDGFEILGTTGDHIDRNPAVLDLLTPLVREVVASEVPLILPDIGPAGALGWLEGKDDDRIGALGVPMRNTDHTIGALCILKAVDARSSEEPLSLEDAGYIEVVASYIAGGLELTQAITNARQAAERAVATVESTPFPLAVLTSDGVVRRVNAAFVDLVGLESRDAAIGAAVQHCGLVLNGGAWEDALATVESHVPWRTRVEVRRRGELRLCEGLVTPIVGAHEPELLLALHDRTEEVRAQRELISREKLATVGELAAGLAHEVNNPLQTIRFEAELLAVEGVDPTTAKAVETIVKEVDRAATIAKQLLRLSRHSFNTVGVVQVNDLLGDVVGIRSRVASRREIELIADLAPELLYVRANSGDLQQVFVNLIMNAEQAVADADQRTVRVETSAVHGAVRVRVSDSGPGVPPDLRSRVFDPFFTTKDPDKATGLGLALTQRIVTEAGGSIWVEDSDLGGAAFVIELPGIAGE